MIPQGPSPAVVTVVLSSSPQDVWQAWTEPDWLRRWFGSHPDGVVLAARADVRPGGSFEVTFRDPSGDAHTCFGTYTLVEAPVKLGFTWAWAAAPSVVERVEVTIETSGSGTRLTLVHSDIDPGTTHGYEAGWTSTFAKLQRALDQGRQVAVRTPGSLRVSSRDREAAVDRLQGAFLDGRLNDVELADRIHRALGAKVETDLADLLSDLPVAAPLDLPSTGSPRPLKFLHAYKGSAVQAGRWTVPARLKSESYKSRQVIDLTKAVITAPRTELLVNAYKSTVEIIVPLGLQVEVRKVGYKGSLVNEADDGSGTGPLLVIQGRWYKSDILIRRGTEETTTVLPKR